MVNLCPEKKEPRTRWVLLLSNKEGQSDFMDRDKNVVFPTKMSDGSGVCREVSRAQGPIICMSTGG